ncbi:MAG: RsmD family RNA methyltransferase [Ichthyobacteriaceae bacterium]|nr:RsmD family RNA methyltransferase [Ichthyobacteriaceae bacterium]
MRIISGKYRGKKLRAPNTLPVRPTTDRAKESLFNILNNDYFMNQITVLDLFAGTGNISLEFASRGAVQITSVDADSGCIKFIDKMTVDLKIENLKTLTQDVFKFLSTTKVKSDIVFADPPYDMSQEDFELIPSMVFGKELLEEGGMLIIEHFYKTDLSEVENYSHSRRYASSVFSFFIKEDEDTDVEETEE